MESPITALENQGLKVVNSRGENGEPTCFISDDDGITYVVSRAELVELQQRGKLTLAGIKEHDEKIQNQTKL